MSALTKIIELGLTAAATEDGRLELCGLSKLTPDKRDEILNFARTNKRAILAALSQNGALGQCEACPAAGYWDYAQYAGQGLLCFHYAYFLGKPGKPKPCTETRAKCPRAIPC